MSTQEYASSASSVDADEPVARKARPQSLLACNFADQLNDIFMINDTLDQLTQSVETKRFSLTTHNLELTALEARLKLAEERLNEKKKRLSLPLDQKVDLELPAEKQKDVDGEGKKVEVKAEGAPDAAEDEGVKEKEFVVVERSPNAIAQ